MTAGDRPRGWCPFCKRDITLTKDGRLRHHGGPEGSGYRTNRAYRCYGTGRLPRDKPTTSPRKEGNR